MFLTARRTSDEALILYLADQVCDVVSAAQLGCP
jgi:hypothetical protein